MDLSHEVSYRYGAFISYRHVEPDRTVAKWLHATLEHFRTPRPLVQNHGVASRVGRIFRDEEELAASADLSEEIDEALEQSRFLIVVCSPRTPESEWVNQEVVRFRQLGRHDQILALLIEGDPQESFPRSLCEIHRPATALERESTARNEAVEPLAADVRPRLGESMREIRRQAKLKLLATLLGCQFDDLRQREHERRVRRLLWSGGVLCVVVVLFAAMFVFALWQLDRANKALVATQRQLAVNYIEKGAAEFEDGVPARGMLHLLRGYETAVLAGDEALSFSARSLLAGWSRSLGQPLYHAGCIALAFSPDSQVVLTAGRDKSVRLWSVATNQMLVEPMFHEDWVVAAAFHPDGSQIITGSGETAQIWNVATGQRSRESLVHESDVHAVRFMDNGTRVLTATSRGAFLWDLAKRKRLCQFPNSKTLIATDVSFNERMLVTGGSDDQAQLWDLTTCEKLGEPLPHDSNVNAVAFSPDGKILLTGSDGGVGRLWKVPSGELLHELKGFGRVRVVRFDPEGRFAFVGRDKELAAWNVRTGELCYQRSQQRDISGVDVAFSRDGNVCVIAGGEKSAHVIQVETGRLLSEPLVHDSPVALLASSPDGTTFATASAGDDGEIRLWKLRAVMGMPRFKPIRLRGFCNQSHGRT